MIRLILLLTLLSTAALGQTQQTFPAYVTSRAPATTPLSGQCFPVSNGSATTKLCSGYAVAIGALSAANNLSDLGSAAIARTNLFGGVSFGTLNKCLGLDSSGNIISGLCGLQTISSIDLSNTTAIGGLSHATVGTVSVSLSPSSPPFTGSLSVDDTTHFVITGNTLETNTSLSSGNYPINIMASQSSGTTNSPVSKSFTIAIQTLQSIALSNNTVVSGQPSGTIVGAITVAMSPTSPAFAGSLSVSGAAANNFQIVNGNLETATVLTSGTYNINLVASQGGATISTPITISATTQTISLVLLSNTAISGGNASTEFVGNVYVIMSPATPAFSGSLSLTGSNASSFSLAGTTLNANPNLINGTSYSFNIVANQPGAIGSPATLSETVTPAATTWVNDQTQVMPWVCLKHIFVNPSSSASGAFGGGKTTAAGGAGTLAAPFLRVSDLTSQTITPGTCIDVVNSATLYDAWDGSTASYSGSFFNGPDGYVVIEAVDNQDNFHPYTTGSGVTANSDATIWTSDTHTVGGGLVGMLLLTPPADYWRVEGFNIWMRGQDRAVSGMVCVSVGGDPGNNVYPGLTHFQAQDNYVHGCGGGSIAVGGSDYTALQNNICQSVTISNPTIQDSCWAVAGSEYKNGYTPAAYDNSLCTTMNGSCLPYHVVITGNLAVDPYEALVNPSTDGNCNIIDTNVLNAVNSNAGPYIYRSLVANNVMVHCGGRGIYAFHSQHVDYVNNTVIRSSFTTNQAGGAKADQFCFGSNDCYMANNLSYGVAGNTFVRVTGTGTTLSVDDVAAFLHTQATGNPTQPPSGSNPINVTVNGVSNTVTGVITDSTNASTTPGGVSGVLTFGTAVASPNGNSGSVVAGSGNGFQPSDSPNLLNFGMADLNTNSYQTCINWGQPVPCSGGNLINFSANGTGDFWYNNLGIITESPNPSSYSAIANDSVSVPPSQTGSPGNNIVNTNPSLTTVFFPVSPDYEMRSISISSTGSNCAAGEMITLAGGSPDSSPPALFSPHSGGTAIVEVDAVSNGHIVAYHEFDGGAYLSNSTTNFTIGSTTGSCTGATFVGATFFQPFLTTALPILTLQGGSPALSAGNSNFCPSHNFTGASRSCPPNIGAY